MYDMHYDLLTILIFHLKRHQSFDYLAEYLEILPKIYSPKNILGGIINLYFAPEKEMLEELDISLKEMQNIVTMFSKSLLFLENMKILGLIPENTDFLYGIEGCDYIQGEQTLIQLYNLGLRAITPVYKYKNQFGSGYLEEGGLSSVGEKFLKKAIDLGMIIDVSHANEETFYDILKVVVGAQQEGKRPTVIASHSNVRELCDRKRNLTQDQLIALKNARGYISLFTNGNFVSLDNEEISYEKRQQNFLKHIDYVKERIGFSEDKILLATDDMNFHPDSSYHHLEFFPIDKIKIQLENLLISRYGEEFTKKIMTENAKKLIKSIK